MTETPNTPEPEHETPASAPDASSGDDTAGETPAGRRRKERRKKERRKRSLIKTVAIFTGIGAGALMGVGLIAVVGGRYYLLSDAGRELVTSFIAGKKIGRYGAINVEGVRGDLFDDFTISKITVTDIDGVWLTANDVRVDWSFWPLVMRRFHADEITAKNINVIRRPVLEPPTEPGGPMPISVSIDKFATDLHLMEDFSKEYGHWKLAGDANIPRNGAKDVNLDALSLSRPGDFLKLAATFSDKPEELRLNLRAQEASGGPLAGAMGYSPDMPFSAVGIVDGTRADIVMTTGNFTPLKVHGRFAEEGSRLSGYMDFSGSDLFAPFIDKVGQTTRFGFAAVPVKNREGVQAIGWKLVSDNVQSNASGIIATKDGFRAEDVALGVNIASLSRLAGMELADATSFQGRFSGDATTFSLKGQIEGNNVNAADYKIARLSGPVELSAAKGEYNLEGQLKAQGATATGMIGGLMGTSPSLDIAVSMLKDGAILLRNVDLRGQAARLSGSGRRNLLGGMSFDGDVAINDLSRLRTSPDSPALSGALNAKISARSERARAPWSLSLKGQGNNLKTGIAEPDRLLGSSPRLELAGTLNNGVVSITKGRLDGIEDTFVNAMGQLNNGNLALKLNWHAAGEFLLGPIAIPQAIRGSGALTGSLNYPVVNLRSDFQQIRLTETVGLDNAQLAINYSAAKHSNGSNGFVDLRGVMGGHQAYARSFYSFVNNGIQLNDLNVNAGGVRAAGSITLSDNLPSSADLQLSARPGALIQTGWLNGSIKLVENAPSDIRINGQNLRISGVGIPIENVQIEGTGNIDQLDLRTFNVGIGGTVPVRYNGSLIYSNSERDDMTFRPSGELALRGQTLRTTDKNTIRLNNERIYADFALANSAGTPVVTLFAQDGARAGAGYGDHRWHLFARFDDLPMSMLAPEISGTLNGNILLGDNGRAITGRTYDLKLANLVNRDAGSNSVALNLNIDALLDPSKLDLVAKAVPANGSSDYSFDLDVDVPVKNTGSLFALAPSTERSMEGELTARGEIASLWNLIDGLDRTLSGQLDSRVRIRGNYVDVTDASSQYKVSIEGNLGLTDGSFHDKATGARVNKLNLQSTISNDGIFVSRLQGQGSNAGSSICGYGYIALTSSYVVPNTSSAQAQCSSEVAVAATGNTARSLPRTGGLSLYLKDFQVLDNENTKINMSGHIDAIMTNRQILLTGNLNANQVDIAPNIPPGTGITRLDVIEFNRPAHLAPRAQATQQAANTNTSQNNAPGFSNIGRTPVRLGIDLKADSINVKGRGIDLMLSTNARVEGTLENPRLSGRAEVVRGTYEFGGKRFTFDPTGYATLDTSPERIRLNLSARREDSDITAVINVTGTAAMPRIELTSEPELPQDEILARVLFGRSVTQLSALEAAQLASSVASLAGGGNLDVLGGLRDLAQLDSLSFSSDGADMMISGGRRIGKNLFLEVQSGGASGPAINVEWQIKRGLAVKSTMAGDGNAIISIRWRRSRP